MINPNFLVLRRKYPDTWTIRKKGGDGLCLPNNSGLSIIMQTVKWSLLSYNLDEIKIINKGYK